MTRKSLVKFVGVQTSKCEYDDSPFDVSGDQIKVLESCFTGFASLNCKRPFMHFWEVQD